MRKVHLAPRLKLWLILGTTAGLIITALLALMLAWGPPPVVETPNATAPLRGPFAPGSVSGAVVAPWAASLGMTLVPSVESGANSVSNQPMLVLSSGVVLALSFGALWVARQRRDSGGSDHAAPLLNTRAKVSPAASL